MVDTFADQRNGIKTGQGRRLQTNSRVERFIQSALRESAYGYAYANSEPRCATWPLWNHFYN